MNSAKLRLTQLKTGSGDIGQLPTIDSALRDAEQQRQILQAEIKRNFTDKGLATPAEDKRRLEAQNLRITDLDNQRADIAKPFTLDLSRADQQINAIKAQIESLKSPEGIAAVGGSEAALKLTEDLKASMERLKQFKAEAESTLAALRIDPVLAFSNALRQLNLKLAEGQEKNKEKFTEQKLANASEAITGFSTDKLASRKLTFLNANDEYNAALADEKNYAAQDKAYNEAVNRPEFQSTLKRLGVAPDSSIAKIGDVLKNTIDEADKGILEKLKSGRESKVKFAEAKQTTVDTKAKLQQTVQDTSLYLLDDSASKERAQIQKVENDKISFLKGAQAVRLMSEEIVNEQIAKVQLNSSQAQKKSIVDQLTTLRVYHDQGKISAEKFTERQRALSVELTATERQEAENRLAVQQAVTARRLKDIEFINKKAENAIALSQATSTTGVKTGLLASGITISNKDSADLEQNSIGQKAAIDRTALIKIKIAQNKQEYKEGLRSAREFAEQQMALNLELAESYSTLADLKIAAEEKYRAIVERNISTKATIASTAIDKRLLAAGLTPEATDVAAIDKNKAAQQEVVDKIKFIKSRVKNEHDAKDELAALDSQLTKLKIESEEKYRENYEHSIQRIMQAEENRFKKQQSQLDESKAKLDLYNQSLERTNKLEQSRQSLSKALSEASLAPLENQKTDTDDAQSLVDKLKDPNVKRRTKRAAREQLRNMGYEVNSNTKPEEIELQIKEKKIEAEKKMALIKQMALEKEQEFQRKALENDLKRQKIAAQTLLYEAQSAQLAAQKSKNEAEGALKIAIAKKDPLAIETAQTNLEIADKQVTLSNERVANAQANLNDQPEIERNATAEQKATQDAQNQSFEYGEKRRQQQGALDLVEAGEKARRPVSLSSAEAKVESTNPQLALPQKIDINQMPKLELKPGENIFEAYQRQRDGMKLPAAGAQLPSSKADMPPIDTTSQAIKSTTIQPRESTGGNQFVEALKMANQGIEQRLDALRSAIITLANTPRSISVSTANPIDDTADLINKLGRGQVVAAGM